MKGPIISVVFIPSCLVIEWGCTDLGDGICNDAWVSAKTRKRIPDPYTWKKILHAMRKLFGITEAEIIRRDQSSPCVPDPPHKHKYKSNAGWESDVFGSSDVFSQQVASAFPDNGNGDSGFNSNLPSEFASIADTGLRASADPWVTASGAASDTPSY